MTFGGLFGSLCRSNETGVVWKLLGDMEAVGWELVQFIGSEGKVRVMRVAKI